MNNFESSNFIRKEYIVNKQINFNCPGFYAGFSIYKSILDLQRNIPEIFHKDIQIESIFDAFPNMIWNGGTIVQGFQPTVEDIENIIQFYYDNKIEIALTMTNPRIEKTDIYDRYCNKVLSLCQNEYNSILVSSPILEDYIREKYPLFKIKRSIIASNKNVDYLSIIDKYDKIVLPRRQLKDFDFLETIPNEIRGRFEFLCDDPCPISCPYLYKHYQGFAKITLFEDIESSDIVKCKTLPQSPLRNSLCKEDQISFKEIIDDYLPRSFNSFKISGRTNKYSIIFSILPYLFKEEYQIQIARYLCETT